MFEVQFSPTDEFKQKFLQLSPEKKNLLLAVLCDIVSGIFSPNATGYMPALNPDNTITIAVKGVVPFQDSSCQTYAQMVSDALRELQIRVLFYVVNIRVWQEPLDRLMAPDLLRKVNCHENLREVFGIGAEVIPPEFVCVITKEIMITPCYLVSNPKVNYEYSALMKWIREKGTDPTTRAQISAVGIVVNHDLKRKISAFLIKNEKLGLNLKEEKASSEGALKQGSNGQALFQAARQDDRQEAKQDNIRLADCFKSCGLAEDFAKFSGKALRRAAHKENLDAIKALFRDLDPKSIVDQQDDNPKTKYTASHVAFLKEKFAALKALIENDADLNIPDAGGQTVLSLLEKSQDERSKPLLAIYRGKHEASKAAAAALAR